MKAAVVPLKDTGLMDLIGPERVLTDEVTLLHTPGHTPGSVTVLVQSGSQAALLIGDAAHHPAHPFVFIEAGRVAENPRRHRAIDPQRLVGRGKKSQLAVIAVARELCGFVLSLMAEAA